MGPTVDSTRRHDVTPAPEADIRAIAVDVLATYGIDADDAVSMTVDLTPYGVPCLTVRLVLTPDALAALRSRHDT